MTVPRRSLAGHSTGRRSLVKSKTEWSDRLNPLDKSRPILRKSRYSSITMQCSQRRLVRISPWRSHHGTHYCTILLESYTGEWRDGRGIKWNWLVGQQMCQNNHRLPLNPRCSKSSRDLQLSVGSRTLQKLQSTWGWSLLQHRQPLGNFWPGLHNIQDLGSSNCNTLSRNSTRRNNTLAFLDLNFFVL